MSAFVSPHTPSAGQDRPRTPVPPYAAPAATAGEPGHVGRVGPFVPAGWRNEVKKGVVAASAPEAIAAVHQVSPVEQGIATATATAGSTSAESPALAAPAAPAGIPPYRPLRLTPIISAAIRTPLYIPPIPTPSAETAVQDEGGIDPLLEDTAEFPVPSGTWQSLTPLDTPAVAPQAGTAANVEEPAGRDEVPLPWIDAFLAATPSSPMAAIEVPAPVEEAWGMESATAEELLADALAVSADDATTAFGADEVSLEPEEATAPDAAQGEDGWPLDEAVAEFRSLGARLEPLPPPVTDDTDGTAFGDLNVTAGNLDADASPMSPPMSAWSDDDLLDIMPIRHSGRTPLSGAALPADGELWAERAFKAQEDALSFGASLAAELPGAEREEMPPAEVATAEQAAHALELLAQRVRAGELLLPGYDPRMGEPAALVAALAALLGVRLR